MSIFGQYAPYALAAGTPAATRSPRQFIDLIGRFAPDFEDCLEHYEVLGPPDIEARIGLTGGHIFQGEVDARPDVGAPAVAAHAGPGRLPLRRGDPPGGQRDRAQRPQRGDGRARGLTGAYGGCLNP